MPVRTRSITDEPRLTDFVMHELVTVDFRNVDRHLGDGDIGVFDPDAVRILVASFDDAWRSLKTTSGASLTSDKRIELARTILAKRIIESARRGERDQRHLCEDALIALAQSNLRDSPRYEK